MKNFLVTLLNDPGRHTHYMVEGVADHLAARKHVLNILGYDPGVRVEITETPIDKNQPKRYSGLGRNLD